MLILDGATLRREGAAHLPPLAWTEGRRGVLHAEVGPFLLKVHPGGSGGYARFLVLRQQQDAPGPACILLASGSRDNVPAALSSAEQAVRRVECL